LTGERISITLHESIGFMPLTQKTKRERHFYCRWNIDDKQHEG